jgi:hypothetical protein
MVTTTPQRCWLPIFTKGLLGVNLIHLGGRVATPWALRAPDLAGWIVQHYLRREYGNVVLNALASAWYSAAVSRTDFQLARTASTKSLDIVLSKFEGHQRKWWSAKIAEGILGESSYFACASPATTAANLSSICFQPSTCPLSFAFSMVSFPMKVSFVRPFPRSSKIVTSCASAMASCFMP